MTKITAADLGIVIRTGAPALDTLAALAQTMQRTVAEIAAELGVTTRTVHAWIADVRRPSGANRAALVALISDARQRNEQRRGSAASDAAFGQLLVALQTPAQRERWLANRAEMRARFAR